jgi:hypothetical protein
VALRIPVVEFLAQRLGDDGADEEEGGGHGDYLGFFARSSARSRPYSS